MNGGPSSLEDFLLESPRCFPVGTWRIRDLDLWPLLLTCLLSLGVQFRIGQKRHGVAVGGIGWKAGVVADHLLISRLRGTLARAPDGYLPADTLDGMALYHASRVHGRSLGSGRRESVWVTAAIDLPRLVMQRSGQATLAWYDDLPADALELARGLIGPSRGLAAASAAARARAGRLTNHRALHALIGFAAWLAEAAAQLRCRKGFLELWLARQLDLACGYRDVYATIFAQRGTPRLLVMLNSGFANTAGLTAAAKARGVPVVEVQHGAESRAAITSRAQPFDFSRFNTAPDRLVAWSLAPEPDPRILGVGPIALLFPGLIESLAPGDPPACATLRDVLRKQEFDLGERVRKAGAGRKVLVSLQPGDGGDWLLPLLSELPDLFFWVRRHGWDSEATPSRRGAGLGPRADTDLASRCFLPLLLRRASAHLTRFSAVVLEAAAMGVPSVATERYASDLYESQIPAGLLAVEPRPGRLGAVLRAALVGGRAPAAIDGTAPRRLLAFQQDAIARHGAD